MSGGNCAATGVCSCSTLKTINSPCIDCKDLPGMMCWSPLPVVRLCESCLSDLQSTSCSLSPCLSLNKGGETAAIAAASIAASVV